MTDDSRFRGDSFLARRARLKTERQRRASAPPNPPPVPEKAPGDMDQVHRLTDADMPPLESLDQESDFTQFLAEGVSDALRRAALRKLFHLPQFNVLDGLNDYDDDYTKLEKLGDAMTYQKRRMAARDEAEAKSAAAQGPTETDRLPAETPDEKSHERAVAEERPVEEENVEDDGDLEG